MSQLVFLNSLVQDLMLKGKYSDAKQVVINRLQSGKDDEAHIQSFVLMLVTIQELETLVEVPMIDAIEQLVHQWMKEDRLDAASRLVNAPFPEALADALLELKLHISYHRGVSSETMELLQKLKAAGRGVLKMNYLYTGYVIGTILLQNKSYKEAVLILEGAVQEATEIKNAEMLQKLNPLLESAKKMLKEEESSRTEKAQSLVMEVEEEKEKQKKKKKKGKDESVAESGVKKAVDLEDVEEEARNNSQALEDQGGSQIEMKKECREFEVPFHFVREKSSGHKCFIGCTNTNITNVRKSFVEAQDLHINKFQELVDICSTHENLLAVEQALKDVEGSIFLITEVVYTLDHYFDLQREPLPLVSNEFWWEKIQETFWTIFRDIIRALMHLFKEGKACGSVGFNLFVTENGRGRILPSLDGNSKKNEDFRELSQRMKTIITLPCGGNDLTFLPENLKSFFDHVDRADDLLKFVPAEFLADHPYFWGIEENIDFTFKFRKLTRESSEIKDAIKIELRRLGLYDGWRTILDGVYKAVLLKAEARSMKPYRSNVDIVRFFCAVYTHVNEQEYDIPRNGKKFTDEQIENDLISIYPNYYTDMFQCLCNIRIKRREIKDEDLMSLSSVYFRRR